LSLETFRPITLCFNWFKILWYLEFNWTKYCIFYRHMFTRNRTGLFHWRSECTTHLYSHMFSHRYSNRFDELYHSTQFTSIFTKFSSFIRANKKIFFSFCTISNTRTTELRSGFYFYGPASEVRTFRYNQFSNCVPFSTFFPYFYASSCVFEFFIWSKILSTILKRFVECRSMKIWHWQTLFLFSK
jgi:hypothetical protein